MNFEKVTVIDFSDIKESFAEKYGYNVSLYDLFDIEFSNDSYKKLYLDYDEGDNSNLAKVIEMILESGITEDFILVEICW